MHNYSYLQIEVLEEAKRVHPNAQFRLKADGCDLNDTLGESVSGNWSGDIDHKVLNVAQSTHLV